MKLTKIDKGTARKQYNSGSDIYLLPSKAAPNSCWITPAIVSIESGLSFDSIIENYKYYNCSKETGLAVHYYIN